MPRKGTRKAKVAIGDPNDPEGPYVWLKRFLEAMRVKNYSARTLENRESYLGFFIAWCEARSVRHTMATLMLENGADIRYIQEMLGHVELSTTQIYTQVSIRQLKQVHMLTHPGARLAQGGQWLVDSGQNGTLRQPLTTNHSCRWSKPTSAPRS